MVQVALWELSEDLPVRVSRARVDLERYLEDWIEHDPALVSEGLQIVGRQVNLSGLRLDLLAISPEGRWVVIELKAGILYRDALLQALDYASIISSCSDTELRRSLNRSDQATQELVDELLSGEENARDVEVIIVGVGIDSGLECISTYLTEGYGVPLRIITFDVFTTPSNATILLREVTEQPIKRRKEKRGYSISLIEARAAEKGSSDLLKKAISVANSISLYVRPWKHSLTFNSPINRSLTLVYVKPASGERLRLGYHSDNFASLYPVTETEVKVAFGSNWKTHDSEGVQTFLASLQQLFESIKEQMPED